MNRSNNRTENPVQNQSPVSTGSKQIIDTLTPLNLVRPGIIVKIISLPAGNIRAQFIRFGFAVGERVKIIERLPGGTVLIQKNRQQVAIGHQLAQHILVAPLAIE